MNLNLLLAHSSNPVLLILLLGIVAVRLKNDIEKLPNTSKFIALYLLFSIGFKGGRELLHCHFKLEIVWSVLFGIFIAVAISFYCYFILGRKLNSYDSRAIAGASESVSAVTFVTAASFLEISTKNLAVICGDGINGSTYHYYRDYTNSSF